MSDSATAQTKQGYKGEGSRTGNTKFCMNFMVFFVVEKNY